MNNYTPIVKIDNAMESCDLYVKREDLLPFYLGGNKVRIAYEFFSDMEHKDKDCMIGYGNIRSNLCRVLSNMAQAKGAKCCIITQKDDDDAQETFNSKIARLCGSEIYETTKTDVANTVEHVFEICARQGYKPYYIYGDKYGKGNEATPVRAYVKVFEEILCQEKEMGINFDYIFVATGTGMTQSGLIAGQKVFGGNQKIIGVSIARKKEQVFSEIKRYLNAYSEEKEFEYSEEDIKIYDDYLCGGYGLFGQEEKDVIDESLLIHGMPMDTTYTGKAFWGMKKIVRELNLKNKKILFIHTGGTPLFYDNLQNETKNG